LAAYRDVAHNGVRSMQRLANVLLPIHRYRVTGELDGLSQYLNRTVEDVGDDYFDMLNQHRQEWNDFLSSVGSNSWLASYIRG